MYFFTLFDLQDIAKVILKKKKKTSMHNLRFV